MRANLSEAVQISPRVQGAPGWGSRLRLPRRLGRHQALQAVHQSKLFVGGWFFSRIRAEIWPPFSGNELFHPKLTPISKAFEAADPPLTC